MEELNDKGRVQLWLDELIQISMATSYSAINARMNEEEKINRQKLGVLRTVDCRDIQSSLNDYDRFIEIGEQCESVIDRLDVLAETIDTASMEDRGIHAFKNKVAKLGKYHSKALRTLNGLKQQKMKNTLDKLIQWYLRNITNVKTLLSHSSS